MHQIMCRFAFVVWATTAPSVTISADLIGDLAKKETGLDVNSGPPLFAFAKKSAFWDGFLTGRMILCGGKTDTDTFMTIEKSFSTAKERDVILNFSNAGLRAGARRPSNNLDLEFCRKVIFMKHKNDLEVIQTLG